jgi:hypothetical protein
MYHQAINQTILSFLQPLWWISLMWLFLFCKTSASKYVLTRLASGSKQVSPWDWESDTALGDTTPMLLEERWHLIELVEATPVPLNEDVRDPSCKQAPVTNEPLPATMLSALEASLRHADENDEEGVQTAVFAANAAAIPASLKSTPTCTHTHTHTFSPLFSSRNGISLRRKEHQTRSRKTDAWKKQATETKSFTTNRNNRRC